MPFEKGRKKTGGKPLGYKHRNVEEMREFLQKIIDKKLDTLSDDLDAMKPAMRWATAEKMMKYFLPSLTKNENENNNTGEVTVNIIYGTGDIDEDDDKNDEDED